MDSGPTNPPWLPLPSDIPSDSEIGELPWEYLSIGGVLLPVLCALFITIVIVVIASCLIQKKPNSLAAKWRDRSSHTIETSHDATVNHDLYDVIDEVNVPTLPLRCRDKFDSNYIIGSQLLQHSKLGDVFPTSHTFPFNTALGIDAETSTVSQDASRHDKLLNTESMLAEGCSTTQQDSFTEDLSQEERIYETLDRHWAIRNETAYRTLFGIADRNQTFHQQDLNYDNGLGNILCQSNKMGEDLKCETKFDTQDCGSDCHRITSENNLGRIPNTTPLSSSNQENTILCHLSMFRLGSAQDKPILIEKACYHVQPESAHFDCSHLEDISAMLQSTNLRIVHNGFPETHTINGNVPDLILKPANEMDKFMHYSCDENTQSEISKKFRTNYKKTQTAEKLYPSDRIKKSEIFRTKSLDLCDDKEQFQIDRRSELIKVNTSARHSYSSINHEAKRISSKLGPLPPLPVQNDVFVEKEKMVDTSGIDENSYLRYTNSLVPSTESSSIPLVRNFVITHPVISARRHLHLKDADVTFAVSRPQIFCDKRPKVSTATKAFSNTSRQESQVKESMFSSDFQILVPEIMCVRNVHKMCHNSKIEYNNENCNHYFVLEPSCEVSSLSSDVEEASSE